MRECLVDGDVTGDTFDELLETRATFISESIEGVTKQDYFDKTATELSKLLSVSADTDINLWFEEDLFCQVNFWFTIHTLLNVGRPDNLYLVLPVEPNQYAFGYCTQDELEQFYKNRISIDNPELIAELWKHYQIGNIEKLFDTAKKLEAGYPFILKAVQAHIDRAPGDEENGLPYKTVKELIEELGTTEFEPVFREFIKRLPIYGFGDTQVRKILNNCTNGSQN